MKPSEHYNNNIVTVQFPEELVSILSCDFKEFFVIKELLLDVWSRLEESAKGTESL